MRAGPVPADCHALGLGTTTNRAAPVDPPSGRPVASGGNMRPENEWFKPEKLTRYYFVLEAIALVVVLAVVVGAALLSIYTDFPVWLVAGVMALVVLGFAYV